MFLSKSSSPSPLTRAAFSSLFCLSAAAATPVLNLYIQGNGLIDRETNTVVSDVVVGFLPASKTVKEDNAIIKIFNAPSATPLEESRADQDKKARTVEGQVDILRRLTQMGDTRSAALGSGGYYLAFSGFAISCSPKLYIEIRNLVGGAAPLAIFTAKGNLTSSKITIDEKDILMDQNSKKYFTFNKDGSITVKLP